MKLRPEEITSILRERIENFDTESNLAEVGAVLQVGDGIEGLVHISEMSTQHVDSPDQVVTPGEELWVKIIDLDLARRRISLSIKQAAEGGELAEEYREHFEVDEHGNWASGDSDAEREAAWSEYYGEDGPPPDEAEGGGEVVAEGGGDVVAAPAGGAGAGAAVGQRWGGQRGDRAALRGGLRHGAALAFPVRLRGH